MSTTMPRPFTYISQVVKKHPDLWKKYDVFLSGKGKDLPDWPSWCFCPLAASFAIVTNGTSLLPTEPIDVYGCLAAWRTTQGIYRFDPTLAEALRDTDFNDKIPSNVFFGLPEWCVYIEIPENLFKDDKIPTFSGFFAFLEYDVNNGRSEIRFLLDLTEKNELFPLILHLTPDSSITTGFNAMMEEARKQLTLNNIHVPDNVIDEKNFKSLTEKLLPFVLYLCTDQPDITGRKEYSNRMRPRMIKTKKGMRMFPPDQHEIWEVGLSLGKTIREYRTTDNGGIHVGPIPHIRRAHWHTFFTGPRDSVTRGSFLKWIPPISVNIADGEISTKIVNVK